MHTLRRAETAQAILFAIITQADVSGVDDDGNAIMTLTVPPELLDVLAAVGVATENDEEDDPLEENQDDEGAIETDMGVEDQAFGDDKEDFEPDDQSARRPHIEKRLAEGKVERVVGWGGYVRQRLDAQHDMSERRQAERFVMLARSLRRRASRKRRSAP